MNHDPNHHQNNDKNTDDHQFDELTEKEDTTKVGVGSKGGEDDVVHYQATVTVADWVAVSSSCVATTNVTNQNDDTDKPTKYNKHESAVTADVKEFFLENLTNEQGLLLKQFLLLQEKDYRHQLELQLIKKERNHEMMMDRKNHEFLLEVQRKNHEWMLEKAKYELILEKQKNRDLLLLEQKNHELTLEKKNAEILKQQHEFELFKLQHSTTSNENNKDTASIDKEKFVNCTTCESKMEKIQEQIDGMVDSMNIIKNYAEKLHEEVTQNLEKEKTRINQEMKLLRGVALVKPIKFENGGSSSWKTFVASSWPAMMFGRHKWTIKYSNLKSGVDFYGMAGVIGVNDHLNHNENYQGQVIGCGVPGRGYRYDGTVWHAGKEQKKGFPKYSLGDCVTFVLDLGTNTQDGNTADDNHGSLYATVNDGEQHLLVSGLSSIGKSKGGFFPAITLYGIHADLHDYEYCFEE